MYNFLSNLLHSLCALSIASLWGLSSLIGPSLVFLQLLSAYLLDEDVSHLDEEARLNREAGMAGLMNTFPRLLQG